MANEKEIKQDKEVQTIGKSGWAFFLMGSNGEVLFEDSGEGERSPYNSIDYMKEKLSKVEIIPPVSVEI